MGTWRYWWRHQFRVEAILTPDENQVYPICTDGKGVCPPENCGGPWGFRGCFKSYSELDFTPSVWPSLGSLLDRSTSLMFLRVTHSLELNDDSAWASQKYVQRQERFLSRTKPLVCSGRSTTCTIQWQTAIACCTDGYGWRWGRANCTASGWVSMK